MKIRKILFAIACMVLASSTLAQSDPYEAELEGVEAKIIKDGDTPLIEIRMFGIDTPEKDQRCERSNGTCWRCGKRATDVLAGLLEGQKTIYKFTGDTTYGRPVATIFNGRKDLNLEMVRQGYAVVYERYLSGSMKTRYLDAQERARTSRKGIWNSEFILPEAWRDGERLDCEQ